MAEWLEILVSVAAARGLSIVFGVGLCVVDVGTHHQEVNCICENVFVFRLLF